MSLTIKILRAKLKIERGFFTTKHPSLYVVAKNQYIKFNTDHHQENKVKDNFRYFAWNQTLPMIPNTSNILKFFIKEKNVRKDTEKAKVVLDLRGITLNNNRPVVLKLPISSKEVSGSLDVEITGKSKNYTNPTLDPEALPGAKLDKALKDGQLTITAGCDEEKHVVHVAENNIINLKKLINNENTLRSFGTTQKNLKTPQTASGQQQQIRQSEDSLARAINKLNFCKGITGTEVDYGQKGLAGARAVTLLGGKRRRRRKRKTRKKRGRTRRKHKNKRGSRRRRTKKRRRRRRR